MTQRIGEVIQKWTDGAPLHDETPLKDKKKVPILFIEGDGLMLKGREKKRHEHFRDTYHVNRKIKERLSFDKKMSGIMIKTIKSYDWDKVRSVLDSVESRIDEPEKEAEYLAQLYKLEQ